MLIAHPDFLTGDVSVVTRNDLQAFDFLGRKCLHRARNERLDLLIGYRHGQMDEMLRIDQASTYTSAQGQVIAGTTVSLFDDFDVENGFHGGQLGLHFQRRYRALTVDVLANLAVGSNRTKVTIDGATITTVPGGGVSAFDGGLLAQQTNIGIYEQSDFSVMPETRITLTTQLNQRTQFSIGYGFLYWSSVARVTDQVDRQVSQFPPEPMLGGGSPRFRFETDGLLAHGLRLGLRIHY